MDLEKPIFKMFYDLLRYRYAFVEFESVADATKALKSSENMKFVKKPLKVQFGLKTVQEQG